MWVSNEARRVSSSSKSIRVSELAATADKSIFGEAHASSSLASSATGGALSRC